MGTFGLILEIQTVIHSTELQFQPSGNEIWDFFDLYMQIMALIVFNCISRIRFISFLNISHILSICCIFSCFLQSEAEMVILIQIHCIGKCDKTEYTCRIVVFITDVSSQNKSKQSQISRWQYADKEYKISFGEDCFYS